MITKISANNINSYQPKTVTENKNFNGHGAESNLTKKQKAVVAASSVAGMTPVLMILAKRKGFSLNPAKILKTPIKDWALFKYKPVNKVIEFEAPQILAVAAGSIAGGFAGGALVDDKKNLRAKKREILSQYLGNITVPVGCVWAGAKMYNKFEKQLINAMPQLKSTTKAAQTFNKFMKVIPNAGLTALFLGIGIYLGNKVSNLINEKLYNKKVERNIKPSDFAPHVDDLCMAISMMNKETSLGSKLGRIIPLALVVPGYQTGIAQEKA
ncbi:MAG: hypothetical protein E7Z87_08550 [Cyanobacteria bacterium SIG26]|nr:hypothetical protein [Cyanobacteria bacterium SIG26]